MIEQLDQKLRERVNKAIGNIRLIASRSKRANLLDATQRAETVVSLLNSFRQYIDFQGTRFEGQHTFTLFDHDQTTLERIKDATNEAGNLFAALSHAKQVSYKDEYKQVWLLLGDMQDYVAKIFDGSVSNAKS